MGDFLDEMAEMMSQENPTVSKQHPSEKETTIKFGSVLISVA
jgi:hypothetical protein